MARMSKAPHTITRTLPTGEVKAINYAHEREARTYAMYMLADNGYVRTRKEASDAATALKLDEPATIGGLTLVLSKG